MERSGVTTTLRGEPCGMLPSINVVTLVSLMAITHNPPLDWLSRCEWQHCSSKTNCQTSATCQVLFDFHPITAKHMGIMVYVLELRILKMQGSNLLAMYLLDGQGNGDWGRC